MLSEDCKSHLDNWKFEQAAERLDERATEDERDLVNALAQTFGNPGWFAGSMGTIVAGTIDYLVREEEKTEKRPTILRLDKDAVESSGHKTMEEE